MFSYAPKIALFALFILGVVVCVEIALLLKRKKKPKKQETVELKPLKFSKVRSDLQSPQIKVQQKKHIHLTPVLITLILFVVALTIAGFLIMNKSFFELPDTPLVNLKRPKVAQVELQPEIVVYKIIGLNTWKQILQSDLSNLANGEIIKIAAKTKKTPKSVVIYVNDQQYAPVAGNTSPNGEPYIDYIIPDGVVDYTIRIEVQ
jgi:hypothetical protein